MIFDTLQSRRRTLTQAGTIVCDLDKKLVYLRDCIAPCIRALHVAACETDQRRVNNPRKLLVLKSFSNLKFLCDIVVPWPLEYYTVHVPNGIKLNIWLW